MATITDLLNTLEAALDYEATGSVSSAQTVVTTCNKLLARRPTSSSHGGSALSYDASQLEKLRDQARFFISANRSGGRVKTLGVARDFRRSSGGGGG